MFQIRTKKKQNYNIKPFDIQYGTSKLNFYIEKHSFDVMQKIRKLDKYQIRIYTS
jgi:hypothetical protein